MKRKQMTAVLLSGAILAQAVLLGACSGQSGVQTQETVRNTVQTQDAAAQTESADKTSGQETAPEVVEVSADGNAEDKKAAGEEKQDGVNGFAFRFTKEMLAEKDPSANMVVSPYSVWLPLAALVNASDEAARQQLLEAIGEAGISEEELNEAVKALNSALTSEERAAMMKEAGVEFESPLKIANAIFVGKNETVKQEFADLFAENFGGKLFPVDFAGSSAADAVNAWAKEQTEGRITDMIDSFDPKTVAAIANAIYFSDAWATGFLEEDTKDDIFHGQQEETVPFMNHKFTDTIYYEDGDMQAVILHTINNGQMVICLPKEGKNAEELLAGMNPDTLAQIRQSEEATVQLSLPKFKLEGDTFSVKEAMEKLGVPLTDPQNPHIDGLTEGDPLFISEVLQKAMIEVDENGLTAAAVTVMGLERMSMPIERKNVEMKCDRPFAFVLTADGGESGQQVLFTGVVNQPSATK